MLVELAVPDEHYNMGKEFEGTITNFEKWWGQFSGTPLGRLFEIALERSPLLEKARNELREVAYKYGMKEDNVEKMVTNLNDYIKISVLAPESNSTTPMNFSATHVLSPNGVPQDFEQAGKNYFRLFKLDVMIDIFGRNRSWREAAMNDITSSIEVIRDVFSIIRLNIARHFAHIRAYQLRIHKLTFLDCDCDKLIAQMERRVKAGVHDSKELEIAYNLIAETAEHAFSITQSLKQEFHSLLVETGIASLEELIELIGEGLELPKVNENVLVGTPMNVILNRPEIVVKLNILKHICGIIGITLADRFPNFKIQTIFETSAKSLYDLVKKDSYSFAYGYKMDHNVFEQSKVTAKLLMHRSAYQKAASEYKSVVANALIDVADKMVRKGTIQRELAYIDSQISASEAKITKIKAKLDRSSAFLLETLQTEKGKIQLVDQKIVLETEDIISTMELVRSLGG